MGGTTTPTQYLVGRLVISPQLWSCATRRATRGGLEFHSIEDTKPEKAGRMIIFPSMLLHRAMRVDKGTDRRWLFGAASKRRHGQELRPHRSGFLPPPKPRRDGGPRRNNTNETKEDHSPMTASFLHGVEVLELDTGIRPIRTVRSAVIGIIGTAPQADAAVYPEHSGASCRQPHHGGTAGPDWHAAFCDGWHLRPDRRDCCRCPC